MRAEEDTTIAVDAPPEAEAPPPVVDVADAPVIQNRAALLLPLTGPRARVGRSLANAANMALQDLGGGNIKLQTGKPTNVKTFTRKKAAMGGYTGSMIDADLGGVSVSNPSYSQYYKGMV